MNLVQTLAQAQLVCMGTALSAPSVAAMHMLGLIVAQLFFLALSGVSRYAIATPDVTVGLLCHVAVVSVYESSSHLSAAAQQQTAFAALCVSTMLQGSCYLALGHMRASELVQYLPYPVVCGLLGVTGLGICSEALGISGFHADTLMGFVDLAQRHPAQLAATIAFASTSVGISALSNSGTAVLLCVPAALLLFYGGASFNETSEAALVADGWLFARSGHTNPLADMWAARDLTLVYWRVAIPDTISTALRMLISLTALVLKVIALEASAGMPVDIDAELRTAGVANLAVGVLGGSLANHSALYVGPLRRAGVSDRRVAAVTMGITALVLASGLPLMDVMPRFVLAGLLLGLGLQMCMDWVWTSRRRMDTTGAWTLWAMILTMLLAGSTNAYFVALLAAVGSSHLRMARLNALKYHRTGHSLHAPVSRLPHARRTLEQHGHVIHLLGLEGFLFEGSTTRLLRYVLAEIRRSAFQMRFLVLDMAYCQGCDPSACALLGRAARTLSDRRVRLILANADPSLLPVLVEHQVLPRDTLPASLDHGRAEDATPMSTAGGLAPGHVVGCARHFATVDQALEWCEDELLLSGSPTETTAAAATAGAGAGAGGVPGKPQGRHVPEGASSKTPAAAAAGPVAGAGNAPFAPASTLPLDLLQPYGVQQPAKPGQVLSAGGANGHEIFIVPPFGVSVDLTVDMGDARGPMALATLRHGGLFGAEGALLGVPSLYSARVHSVEPRGANLMVIGSAGLAKLRSGQPALLQRLLATAVIQQQGVTLILARHTALWQGGGWRGPNWEASTRPEAAWEQAPTAGFPLQLPPTFPQAQRIPNIPSRTSDRHGRGESSILASV